MWQITWDDVIAWERALGGVPVPKDGEEPPVEPLAGALAGTAADAAWPPYQVAGETSPGGKVRARWQARGRDPRDLDTLVFAGAIPALLGFLRVPDLARWRELATTPWPGCWSADSTWSPTPRQRRRTWCPGWRRCCATPLRRRSAAAH
ncbi:hypothetical protein E1265_33620 [Streptomyces sp. 8K308]|uniref:hypothetical protein n=1 Tax=Streptomyces sp. 8K308 TaxID=2530388 RepID=UPI0010453E8F|nr:hypothetical protein [Streptomyces sp. 8K308]TDC07948.1 hypothetical protein E1265_33620 [Streptomyces sp. 8K308]